MPENTNRTVSRERLVLGRAVRELRARRGLTQETLGFESHLPGEAAEHLHRNYVGAIERGEVNVTFRILLKLAHGLGVPLSMLIRLYERRLEEP